MFKNMPENVKTNFVRKNNIICNKKNSLCFRSLKQFTMCSFLRYVTYSPNLRTRVGDLAGGRIRCLGDEVDNADEFQDFIHVRWKKEVFLRF